MATIPGMQFPMHYKLDANGEIVEGIGELYRNNSHPWILYVCVCVCIYIYIYIYYVYI